MDCGAVAGKDMSEDSSTAPLGVPEPIGITLPPGAVQRYDCPLIRHDTALAVGARISLRAEFVAWLERHLDD